MKKIALLLACLTFSALAFAQNSGEASKQQTLWGSFNSISGFGGFALEFGSIGNNAATFTGGGGALLLNKKVFIGGYGMGLSNNPTVTDSQSNQTYRINFGHGGFWAGGIIGSDKLVHLVFSGKFVSPKISLKSRSIPMQILVRGTSVR